MAKIIIPGEFILIEFDDSTKKVNVLESQGKQKEIDDTATAMCDICSAPLGRYKDIKHLIQPESISRAVAKGFRPTEMIKRSRKLLISSGQKDHLTLENIIGGVVESWIDMVNIGQTPWAVCENCNKNIQTYTGTEPSEF